MVYTTACERCRKMRMKCERPSRGQDEGEICQRCALDGETCITKKRRVGRQPGVKNRKTREGKIKGQGSGSGGSGGSGSSQYYTQQRESNLSRDQENLPNPLQVLASEAVRRQSTPESDITMTPSHPITYDRDSASILDRFSDWTTKIHGITGKDDLMKRIDSLLSSDKGGISLQEEEPSVFCGRTDMARPDAAPEHDVISLQMISLSEAQRLFDAFMNYLTNGSMYFDPKIHSLPFIRSRSSFLLAVILCTSSTYTSLCSSNLLHSQLINHTNKMVSYIRENNLKSIEIVQGLLLLASWIEIPHTLSRDKTWAYVSYATALAVELRLDSPLPFCVQMDPIYSTDIHDLLVRNAHRVCLLLYIHDRNMAMVAGRYPIFPESTVTSQANLDKWGKHERACRYDAPICASVSLRKVITEVHHKLATHRGKDFQTNMNVIERAMSEWRTKWAVEMTSTTEYDIIARFSTLILALTLLKKEHNGDKDDIEARQACENLAFEVCCFSINNYKSWTGILNSATFDTSMVAFCAIYTLQSINRSDPVHLSDWSLFRLATIQELIGELEQQASVRHHTDKENSMSVVDAMSRQLSRGIKLILTKKQIFKLSSPSSSSSVSQQDLNGQGNEGEAIDNDDNDSNTNHHSYIYNYDTSSLPSQHHHHHHHHSLDMGSNSGGGLIIGSDGQTIHDPSPQNHHHHEIHQHHQQFNTIPSMTNTNTVNNSGNNHNNAIHQDHRFDDLTQLLSSNNAIPFIPDWNLESLLPDAAFNWDHTLTTTTTDQSNQNQTSSNNNNNNNINNESNNLSFFDFTH
ncbi:uncharacterized protein L201_003057 [Kwoniella dendrophila CBS 6074]|uniref:Zn(2)-C6 fungal-type domain-containing protein n=1 Tax=Kwoniella dendrophila CBS 6074 TaxID=1295534 RepID=A0AAX4JUC7_9TREE